MLAVTGITIIGFNTRSHKESTETMTDIIPVVDMSTTTGMKAQAEPAVAKPEVSPFEQAVTIIKKYEGLHSQSHWPLVGYGHKVRPGEKYNRSSKLSEKEAEALLRKDLLKNCAKFREFGADSLLLGVLAYNIGSGATMRSSVVKKLRAGDRDIESSYLAHCRYRGKVLSQIQRRRVEEFNTLFIEDVSSAKNKKIPEANLALTEPKLTHNLNSELNNIQKL